MNTAGLQAEVSHEAQDHPHWVHVLRVCNSQGFRTSARLRDFLVYVADCALRDTPGEATEQHIGIHVFGRMPGYNSSEDSIVRTHARLLRGKLAEFYRDEGAHDDVVIEMPKGHYLPVFQLRQVAVELTRPPEVDPPQPPAAPIVLDLPPAPAPPARKRHLHVLIALVLCAALAVTAWRVWPQPDPVQQLWSPFLSDSASLVIYSNAVFLGDARNGLRYAAPDEVGAASTPDRFVETYTGIGELASVYTLTQLFDRHKVNFLLKRSMLVTWDEARDNNLIFLGSTAENPSLRVLPATHDFTMITGDGFAGFSNHRPAPGEPAMYTRPEHPLTKDYAIIALLPGLQPGKRVLVFSGLTTFGTQAAVEFACHRDTARQLVKRATGPHGEVQSFEAILETSIGGGVPLATRLVSLHTL